MFTKAIPAYLVVALALVIPWMTWWTLTTPNPNMAVTETPIYLSGVGFVLVLAAWMLHADLWLGLLVGYAVLRVFPTPTPYSFEVAYLFGLGACAFVFLQQAPASMIPRLKTLVIAGGALQACYGILQYFGHDPIWIPWTETVNPILGIRGTLGNRDFFGAYSAICLVLGPVWLMPLFVASLIVCKGVLPLLACAVGLIVRFRRNPLAWNLATAGLVGGTMWAFLRPGALATAQFRLDVWWWALKDLAHHPIIGWGTGSWPLRIPNAQLTETVSTISRDVFVAAHNDWLQLVYEGGAIGALLLIGWLWYHRRMFLTESGGAVAVIAANAFGNFPFHVGTTALLSLVVVGFACAEARALAVEPITEDAHDPLPLPHPFRWDFWASFYR